MPRLIENETYAFTHYSKLGIFKVELNTIIFHASNVSKGCVFDCINRAFKCEDNTTQHNLI